MKPGKHQVKAANKEAKIYVASSKTVHIFCFALICYLFNYVIAMFLLVSWMNTRNHVFVKICAWSTLEKRTKIYNKELCLAS